MPARESVANNERPQRVFLIDSMSHIFRAFFAPMQNRAAPLATSQGFVTQAVYIFTNMLLKLLREEKPDYIAAIFESPRHPTDSCQVFDKAKPEPPSSGHRRRLVFPCVARGAVLRT